MRPPLAMVSGALLALAAAVTLPACDHWPGLVDGAPIAGAGTSLGGPSQLEDSSGRLGSSCGSCQTGLTCSSGYPNGLCTRECQSSADCSGGVCVLEVYPLVCMTSCVSDATCRPGYHCETVSGGSVCVPGSAASDVDAGVN